MNQLPNPETEMTHRHSYTHVRDIHFKIFRETPGTGLITIHWFVQVDEAAGNHGQNAIEFGRDVVLVRVLTKHNWGFQPAHPGTVLLPPRSDGNTWDLVGALMERASVGRIVWPR